MILNIGDLVYFKCPDGRVDDILGMGMVVSIVANDEDQPTYHVRWCKNEHFNQYRYKASELEIYSQVNINFCVSLP